MLRGGNPEKRFAEALAKTVRDSQDILDIGTSQRFAKELRPYEGLFKGKRYTAAGYQPSSACGAYSCDCHQDIENMTFADASFDAVLCIEVLEHVADPFAAARELARVLRPDGRLLLTTPFLYNYHGKRANVHSPNHESYPDYWRFTHEGLAHLFAGFRDVRVSPLNGPIEFRLAQFFLEPVVALPPLRKLVDWVDHPQRGRATSRHLLLAVK
jgi:SAM-dependent methyltransferase